MQFSKCYNMTGPFLPVSASIICDNQCDYQIKNRSKVLSYTVLDFCVLIVPVFCILNLETHSYNFYQYVLQTSACNFSE